MSPENMHPMEKNPRTMVRVSAEAEDFYFNTEEEAVKFATSCPDKAWYVNVPLLLRVRANLIDQDTLILETEHGPQFRFPRRGESYGLLTDKDTEEIRGLAFKNNSEEVDSSVVVSGIAWLMLRDVKSKYSDYFTQLTVRIEKGHGFDEDVVSRQYFLAVENAQNALSTLLA